MFVKTTFYWLIVFLLIVVMLVIIYNNKNEMFPNRCSDGFFTNWNVECQQKGNCPNGEDSECQPGQYCNTLDYNCMQIGNVL